MSEFPSLSCIGGGLVGRQYEITETVVLIGRHRDCGIRVNLDADKMVSARHAQLGNRDGCLYARDLASTNGTYVNGERLIGEKELQHGDRLELGRDGVVFLVSMPAGPLNPTMAQAALPVNLAQIPNDNSHTGRTGFYQAMMEDAVEKSSSRLKWLIGALSLVLLCGVIGVTVYIMEQRAKTNALENQADAAREQQIYTTAELKKAEAGQDIAKKYGRALFMLIAQKSNSQEEGFCTAFVIKKRGVLATNAHCVKRIKTYRKAGIATLARMNENPETTFKVTDWKSHPKYNNTTLSPDLALLRVALNGNELPEATILASVDTVRSLVSGDKVYTMGFPGEVMNVERPAANLRSAIISRLTTYQNAPGDAEATRVLWHTALTSPGTSGSPIFNTDGHVVAVNNGGMTKTAGLNFGIRVDTLRELLQK